MLEQNLEILHGNTAAVLFYFRTALSAFPIKKNFQLLGRGKSTSEIECGEDQKFQGTKRWIKIRMGMWRKTEFPGRVRDKHLGKQTNKTRTKRSLQKEDRRVCAKQSSFPSGPCKKIEEFTIFLLLSVQPFKWPNWISPH